MNDNKGHRLKVARKAANLSQKQLGERLGFDQALVSRVENGTNEGTVSFWRDAALLLGVSLDYLLLDETDHERVDKGRPQPMNKMAILSDYSLSSGLRALATDAALVEALAISDDEWTQLAAIALPRAVPKEGYLQLLLTLRNVARLGTAGGSAE